MRRAPIAGAAALAPALAAATLSAGPANALPKLTECQRPVSTGEEVYRLVGVSAATACPVVRALARWEYHPVAHIRELYTCVGPGHHRPALVRHRFDGWRITLTPAFRMSRGAASFEVTRTDFPVNCS